VKEIAGAGFAIEPHRVVEETISGASCIKQRPGFTQLLVRMERGDVLVVSKLDRLGRNVVDIVSTVDHLASLGIKAHCLQLGGADLTSAASRLTMRVLGAVAQFERDVIIERTQAGLQRAWAEGKKSGRKHALTEDQRRQLQAESALGTSIGAFAKLYGTSRQTILRARAA
jgi:putative DNA-invertase from lambdoid prophage Rac